MTTLGEKLKGLRTKFNLKQLDLANSLQVSPQAVSKWERDENYPDILTIKKIARLFDVTVDELLGMYDEEHDVFEATVFCSGVKGFAEKAKRLSPKELAGLMNGIFFHMTETVLEHGGVPVKYTGDGFLCFFSGTGHADRALDTAVEILRAHQGKDIVILLNSGRIYLGSVGHPDYASKDIYGDAVNRAFLMMEAFSSKVRTGIGCSPAVKDLSRKQRKFKLREGFRIPHLAEKSDLYELGVD
jgi:class 3 adenylate cyclase